MGKIVVSEFLSLDGVMQDPGGVGEFPHGGWNAPYWSDELAAFKHDELFASDGLLLGRVTYQGFAVAWPTATDEGDYAERMNSFPKYVVSRTLEEPTWTNSRVLSGDTEKEVTALRDQAPDQTLLVFGSGQLVRSLIGLNLIDELRLQVHPVVIGSGTPLFGPTAQPLPLRLHDAKPLASGVVILTYNRLPTPA
jgi:dihydrofolate reductase